MTMDLELERITLEPAAPADASVIWLHGLGADGNDFVPIVPALELPSEHRIRFIFPHAPVRPITINSGMQMRGWYDIAGTDLKREVDEAGIRDSAAAVATIIDAETAAGIEPGRIVLAGFSQGGAIALHLGLRHNETVAGIMALSTYLPLVETLEDEMTAAATDIPILMAHGTHDPLVPEEFGRKSADYLANRGFELEYHTYPMDHAVCVEEIRDIAHWLKRVLSLS